MLKSFPANSRIQRRPWFYPLISAVVALSVLGTAIPGQAFSWTDLLTQGVQLVQLSTMSTQQEVDMGKQINQKLVNGQIKLYKNSAINQYVEEVGKRLALNSDRPNLPYTFQIVDDSAVNAFATTGGFVYVNKGLLKTAANEAELASVIGHEIGHIGGKHLMKQMRSTALANGVATVAGVDRNQLVQLGMQLALNLPHSRKDEFEADQRGLRTLGRSGYSQSAMVSFMKKLLSQGSVPTFLSNHPATGDRIVALQKAIKPVANNIGYGVDELTYKARMAAL